MKRRFVDRLPKTFGTLLSAIFTLFSIIQYVAYFEGLNSLFLDVAGRGMIVMATVLTYIFRLDIIAASIGFWGIWMVWHWPLWVAILLTTSFQSLSLAINYGPGSQPASFLQRMLRRKRHSSTPHKTGD